MGNLTCGKLTLNGKIDGSAIETKDLHASYNDHDYDMHAVKFIIDGTPHVIQWGRFYIRKNKTIPIYFIFPYSDYQSGGGIGISGYGNDAQYTNGLSVESVDTEKVIVGISGKEQWVKFVMVDKPF